MIVLVFPLVVLLAGATVIERPEGRGDWLRIRTRLLYPRNFVNVRINSHNEKELRISSGKVLAMETSLSNGYSPEYDMTLRQLTDGHRILQAVYQGGELKHCDYSTDSNKMLDFVSTFMSYDYHGKAFGDVFLANSLTNFTQKNVTIAHHNFEKVESLREFSEVVNMRDLRKQCRSFIRLASAKVEEEVNNESYSDMYIDNFNGIAEHNVITDRIDSDANSDQNLISNNLTMPLKRKRRQANTVSFDFSSVLIFPGTKWCGKGDLAKCYDDLGEDQELDMCCRDHDCCPYVIPPFSRKFGIFNYRFHSLLHCDCDQRFRGCLRQSVSNMANMIGKIYFNVLGSKCFEFVETEVCLERSWWGLCQTYEKQTTASVKGQVSFIDENGEEDYIVMANKSET